MRECMAITLAEAEVAKRQAAAVAASCNAEQKALEYRDSVILLPLSAFACINLLLAPGCPLRGPLSMLLDLEKDCRRWYRGPSTKAYFTSLGSSCCECLDTHTGADQVQVLNGASIHAFRSDHLSVASVSAPARRSRSASPALPSAGSSAAFPGFPSAAAASSSAGMYAANAGAAAASAPSSSQHAQRTPSMHPTSTPAPSPLQHPMQASLPATSNAQLLRCCVTDCSTCGPSLAQQHPFHNGSSAPHTSTLFSAPSLSHPTTAHATHPLAQPTPQHLTSSNAHGVPNSPQLPAALAALADLCREAGRLIKVGIAKMPEVAGEVPEIFRQAGGAQPTASNDDSDVVVLEEGGEREVQGRNRAQPPARAQAQAPTRPKPSARRSSKVEPTVIELDLD